jgi:hypothetical protein
MFGERKGKMMKQVTAGSFTGIDEVVFVYLFTEDGTTLYRGRDRTLAKLQPSSRYVISPHSSLSFSLRADGYKGLYLRRIALWQGDVNPELSRFCSGRCCVYNRLGVSRNDQNAYPECQF